jgi:cysteine-rich CPXCG protein
MRALLVAPGSVVNNGQPQPNRSSNAQGAWHLVGPQCGTMPRVSDEFLVTCPFCGEQLEIYVEPDVTGSFIQDCEICCNPWRVSVRGRGEDRAVDVTRADGSE